MPRNLLDEEYKRFKYLCKNATNGEEIFELVTLYLGNHLKYLDLKNIYNKYIGWALPSKQVCNVVLSTYQYLTEKYQDVRIIDYGAGAGVFSFMFNHVGVPENNILAVDLVHPTHNTKKQRKFWKVFRDEYLPHPNDVLFISWGFFTTDMTHIFDSVRSVIILGEINNGCVFPPDYFACDKNWQVQLENITSPFRFEYISVNKRK